jgi:hypothetical protein
MNRTLIVSYQNFYKRLALFVIILLCCSVGLYFLIYSQLSTLIIGIGISSFLVPWSFFNAISHLDKAKRQFQSVTFLEECLLFENLPIQGGEKVQVKIHYENIKYIKISYNTFCTMFVPRYEWSGDQCTYIHPSGFVPKLQTFSWSFVSKQNKKEILDLLELRNVPME